MAIIKCPECGRQISDKAPFCPNCGVQIAGKIIKCPQCGEVYFRDQEMCPICNHPTPKTDITPTNQVTATPQQSAENAVPQSSTEQSSGAPSETNETDWSQPPVRKRKNHGLVVLICIFLVALVAVLFYFYKQAENTKEQESYEYAMKSTDPTVMDSYLSNYPNAPEAHRDSVTARLEQIKQMDTDWSNAVVSGSKEALLDYLAKHPDSQHRIEAQFKIDSIDWEFASNQNTLEAVQNYLNSHPNGRYIEQATTMLKTLKAKTVMPEEKSKVTSVLRRFFQNVNSKNGGGLADCVTPVLTNFLGKSDASRDDVISFMNKIYKDDITNMNWRLGSDMKIDKKDIGDEVYEYSVQCSASQEVEHSDASKETLHYRITATVSPDNQISAMKMVKILN
ncbi:MAG: double zinc ribbon domain-containing protein [Prevotella sp.]|jgi:RNA polymerase subunit RPABC4/transcription elongation factor Spt4